ncbi:MAG: 2-oxoacid:acceptor oxidoreductase family protein [Spirochaetaceae bacterium]
MWKVVISGVGGQGVITAGILLAEAAVIHEGRYGVQSQSYGAEMRGGLSRADVIISDSEIIYPKVEQAHLLVCLHAKALGAYAGVIRPGGILITDADQAPIDRRIDCRQFALALVATAREATGSERNVNVCVLGAVVAITGIVAPEALRAAVRERFGGSEAGAKAAASADARAAGALDALEAGYELGKEHAPKLHLQGDSREAGRHATSARL